MHPAFRSVARRATPALLALLVWRPVPVPAQVADTALLNLRRIYASPEFRPETFGPARWLAGGKAYTTLEASREGKGGQDLVRYDVETGERTVLVPATRLIPPRDTVPLAVDAYSWSADERQLLLFTNTQPVWRLNTRGDYWSLDLRTWRLKQLGGRQAKPSTLMFAKYAPDGRKVAYVRENNLYVEDLATGRITQLTRDGSRTMINGTFDWVYEEELMGYADGWRWSPDGTAIAYWQLNADSVRDYVMLNNTDSLYSQAVPVQYPKAGESNSAARIGIVPAAGGATRWLALPGDPRNHYLARMEWAGSSDEVAVQQLNRLQNTNTVFLGDRRTGSVRPVLVERDSAWVEVADWRWLDGGRRLLWESERDGWNHLYTVSRDGQATTLLTPGDFDVASVAGVDEAGGYVYYIASPDNAAQRYLYRARLDGQGQAERISPAGQAGTHGYNLAPDARTAIHTFSRFGVPPVTDLVSLPDHRVRRVLAANAQLGARVNALERGAVEFFQVDADGVPLNGWIMKPAGFDPSKKYPLFISIYGGPGSQTVLDAWGGANYLWYTLLTQKGYLVASIDNRGTGMRGRAWRKIIYRQLGVVETHDQVAAARAMSRWSYVDPARIGIFGWSYGGFMSLNTLFQGSDVYKMAIAVAPVTHWKYYDNVYTERFNGLPRDNQAGYDAGSPLSHVGGLRGRLLLVHGTGDDNVHYQNTEALVNALVKADKQFDFMSYPNRNHGIFGGNTTMHLRTLLTGFIDETLGPPRTPPAAPAPRPLTN